MGKADHMSAVEAFAPLGQHHAQAHRFAEQRIQIHVAAFAVTVDLVFADPRKRLARLECMKQQHIGAEWRQ
ncbi:hypothetical protein SDC9_174178 [bioreactor metagenome]|uniref:Uncharacterized protein n=1 Tax=bioreactor metagenome TaxID=1076179 RepID=A0A645GT09_9ZZZZ